LDRAAEALGDRPRRGADPPAVEGGRRAIGRDLARDGYRLAEGLREEVAERVALEGELAGEALERDDRERPEVGPMVEVADAARLLGAHVRGRSDERARLGAAREPVGRGSPG